MAVNFICALSTVQARLRFTFLDVLITIATRKPVFTKAAVITISFEAFAMLTGEAGALVDSNLAVCARESWRTFAFIPSVECRSRLVHRADTIGMRPVSVADFTGVRVTVIQSCACPYGEFGVGLL